MAHNFFTRKNLLELHAYVINILSGKYWSLLKNGHCEKGKFNVLFEVDKGCYFFSFKETGKMLSFY